DWALRNIDKFPIEINRAEYHMLLRVPGIGVKSAQRIVSSRRFCQLDFDDLKKLGVVLKRAKYFITCKGIHSGIKSMEPVNIRANILGDSSKKDPRQLSLFDLEGGMGNDLNIELPV
ncbi:MAG TPA: biotin synthase, partial [Tissierellales bacterium]|nr:biotin synthase [Tissierellales bacterium]